MKILIVGSLRPNPDRILALKGLGHNLVYCTMQPSTRTIPDVNLDDPSIHCYVLERGDIHRQISRLIDQYDIDVIYSLLNVWDPSLDMLAELLTPRINIPIVRHYKEHFCIPSEIEKRSLTETDAQIYINEESFGYFRSVYDVPQDSAYIMDGDLIAQKYMTNDFSSKSHLTDGEPHLLIGGGATISENRHDFRELCLEMNKRHIHVHLYCKYLSWLSDGRIVRDHKPTQQVYEDLAATLPYIHVHEFIRAEDFTRVWSRYDAGLMHLSATNDYLKKFERLNYPMRYSAYLAAGLPLAQQKGGMEAMERFVTQEGVGFLFEGYNELAEILNDRLRVDALTEVAIRRRKQFSFDTHAPRLAEILSHYRRS
jgi:hypothetical protein